MFGSGETSPSGRAAHEYVFQQLGAPVDIAILDTPAGFETNAKQVVERIAEFLRRSLTNYRPTIELVHATRADTGTNDSATLAALLRANYLFAGPGSPSYAVRHLRESLALEYLCARWQAGAALVTASAASLALSRWTIPVYEIFKAGHDPHWIDGLDILARIDMSLAIVPHWNNTEGSRDADFTRCFLGAQRFAALRASLDPSVTILGIDEQTSVLLEPTADVGRVFGAGTVTIERDGKVIVLDSGATFALSLLRRSKDDLGE